MRMWKEFVKGLWKENPTFRLVLGMCPTLAVTNAAINGLAMGLATTFVLLFSEIIISAIKKMIPDEVRIPSYIIVIATFVTVIDLILAAYFPDIHSVLGLFIPLIVVNCIILGRAEAFASKNSIILSIADSMGMGLGFTVSLTVIGIIREILGMGSIFGINILGDAYTPIIIFVLAPGAFITLGVLMGIMNIISSRKTTNNNSCS